MVVRRQRCKGRESAGVAADLRVLRDGKWPQALAEALRAAPGDCWQWIATHGRVIKLDSYSCAALIELRGQSCFVKLYRPRGRLHRWLLGTAQGRPLRSQKAARELLLAGVQVPAPRGCLRADGGLLTLAEGLVAAEDMQTRWSSASDAVRRELMSAAAIAMARLHLAGYCHGDCKWSNLLCMDGQVYLVDLDAVRSAPVGGRRQLRDLARFTLNAEELAADSGHYAYFFDVYLAQLGLARDVISSGMLPQLHKLRERHRKQYGSSGQRLW